METKHTPGPWYVSYISQNSKRTYTVDSSQKIDSIALIHNQIRGNETEMNAKLIAVAPELLEAMIEFCERVEKGEVRSTKTYNKFKELIKKATQ